MVQVPTRIALDGCRNAYLCLRQAQGMAKDKGRRQEQVRHFADQGRLWAQHVQQTGGLLARWTAWRLVAKIDRACRHEGLDRCGERQAGTPVVIGRPEVAPFL